MKKFKKPLCMKCQPHQSTPEAMALAKALKTRGWNAELEKWDGFKHIDIAITQAKVNIEVDGAHHNFDKKQALADLKRTFHSFKKDYVTLRIPNQLVNEPKILEETADYINRFLRESEKQLDEDLEEDEDSYSLF